MRRYMQSKKFKAAVAVGVLATMMATSIVPLFAASAFEESYTYTTNENRLGTILTDYPELRDGSNYGNYGQSNIPIFSYMYTVLTDEYMKKITIKMPNIKYVYPIEYSSAVKQAYESAEKALSAITNDSSDKEKMVAIKSAMSYIYQAERNSTVEDENLAGDLDQKDYLIAVVMYYINSLSGSNQVSITKTIVSDWFDALEYVSYDLADASNEYSRYGISRGVFKYFCRYYSAKLNIDDYTYVSDYIQYMPDNYVSNPGETYTGPARKVDMDTVVAETKQSIAEDKKAEQIEDSSTDSIYDEEIDSSVADIIEDFIASSGEDASSSYQMKYSIRNNACYADKVMIDEDGNETIKSSTKLKTSQSYLCTGETIGEDVSFSQTSSNVTNAQIHKEILTSDSSMSDSDVETALKNLSYYYVSYIIDNKTYETTIPANANKEVTLENAYKLLETIAADFESTVYDDGTKKMAVINGVVVSISDEYETYNTSILNYLANGAFSVVISSPSPNTYKDTILDGVKEFDKVIVGSTEVSLTYPIYYDDSRVYVYDKDLALLLKERVGITDEFYLFRNSSTGAIDYIQKSANIIVTSNESYRINNLVIKEGKVTSVDIVSVSRILGYEVTVSEDGILTIKK